MSATALSKMTHAIHGLFREGSPVLYRDIKGSEKRAIVVNVRKHSFDAAPVLPTEYPVQRLIIGAQLPYWRLNLRNVTGRFHASLYINARFPGLAAHGVTTCHDFARVLKEVYDPTASYYSAVVGAAQGDDLNAKEQRLLAEVVLWVSERSQ